MKSLWLNNCRNFSRNSCEAIQSPLSSTGFVAVDAVDDDDDLDVVFDNKSFDEGDAVEDGLDGIDETNDDFDEDDDDLDADDGCLDDEDLDADDGCLDDDEDDLCLLCDTDEDLPVDLGVTEAFASILEIFSPNFTQLCQMFTIRNFVANASKSHSIWFVCGKYTLHVL